MKSFLKDLSNGILLFAVIRLHLIVIVKSVLIFRYFICRRILVRCPNSHILIVIKFKRTRVFGFFDIRYILEFIRFFAKWFFSKNPEIYTLFTITDTCNEIFPKTNIPMDRSFKNLFNGTNVLYTSFGRNGQKIPKTLAICFTP